MLATETSSKTTGQAGEYFRRHLHSLALQIAYCLPLLLVVGRAATDVGISIIAAAFLLHCLMAKNGQAFKQPMSKWLMIFWLILVLGTCMQPLDGEAILHSIAYIRFLLFFIALRYWLYTSRATIIRAALWAVPPLVFVIGDGWWQYFNGVSLGGHKLEGIKQDRLTGPLTHPNIGNYLFKCLLPAAVIGLATTQPKPWNIATYIIAAAGFLLIPLSGERSVTIMLLVSVVSFFALMSISKTQYRKPLLGAFCLLAAVVALLATQPVISERSALFISEVGHFTDSTYGQLFYASYLGWQQSPILGVGMGAFPSLCQSLQASVGITYCDVHSHNHFIQIALSTGLLGLAAFLMALAAGLFETVRAYRTTCGKDRLILGAQLALLAGFLFPALVTQSIYSNWPASIFWFGLAWILSLQHLRGTHD